MINVSELYLLALGDGDGLLTLGNYLGFVDVPGIDQSTWALFRTIVCFGCAIVCLPAMKPRPIGYLVGLAWVVMWAALAEASVEVFNFVYYWQTTPPHILSILEVWAPQSTAYNIAIDAAAALCGTVFAVVMGSYEVVQFGAVATDSDSIVLALPKNTPGLKPGERFWIQTLLRWMDVLLFAMAVPFLFAVVVCWTTIVATRYGSDPTSAFRSSSLIVALTASAAMFVVAAIAHTAGAGAATYTARSMSSDGRNFDWPTARGWTNSRNLVVWATAIAVTAFTGVLCLGRIIPGQAGLYFQPTIFLAGAVVLAVVVRVSLGFRKVRQVQYYRTPNPLPGIGKRLMTNCKAGKPRGDIP